MGALGPAVGFLTGAAFLSIYVDVGHTPTGLTRDSATWVGAWWAGHLLCALLALLAGIPLMFFPKSLPRTSKGGAEEDAEDKPMVFSLGRNLKGPWSAAKCFVSIPLY